MPTITYVPIASKTLTTSAASVTFSGISQAYRDLVLVTNTAITVAGNSMFIRFNSDSGSNYSTIWMMGFDTSTSSGSQSAQTAALIGGAVGLSTTNAYPIITNFLDYSATDKHKTFLTRHNGPNEANATASRWASISAVTSITVFPQYGGSMIPGTTFSLYGIHA